MGNRLSSVCTCIATLGLVLTGCGNKGLARSTGGSSTETTASGGVGGMGGMVVGGMGGDVVGGVGGMGGMVVGGMGGDVVGGVGAYVVGGVGVVVDGGAGGMGGRGVVGGNSTELGGTPAPTGGVPGSSGDPVSVEPAPALDAWIAFDSDGTQFNRDIYVIRSDGAGLRRLTVDSSSDLEPSFSPDGSKIAFASDRERATMQIYVLDLATGTVMRVTSRGEARNPAFSRDGQRIGYRSGGALYTIGLDGSAEQVVVAGSKCCALVGEPFGAPVFSPDGQWIAYDDYDGIYAVHLDGSSERTIVPPFGSDGSRPSLAPDGRNLALQAICMVDSLRVILTVPWNGITGHVCEEGRMISSDGEHPAWGPSDAIVFHTSSGVRKLRLWKDGVIHVVTNGSADDRNPAWSPLGTTIP